MPMGEKASVENGLPRHGTPGGEARFLGEGFTKQCKLWLASRNTIARVCDQSGHGSLDERLLGKRDPRVRAQ